MKSTKHLLFFIIALISINANAQEPPPVTVNVAKEGTLPELIPSSKKNQITNLTLTGYLNGTDIRYIREMAGCDYKGNSTDGKLSVLDLSNAIIVAGGESYYKLYENMYCFSQKDAIGDWAFRDCTTLTSVTIPNSVTSIGFYAFRNCTRLTSVVISNRVTSIGSGAFFGCTGLTSVTIPNTVTTIGGGAFENCTGLTSLIIPNSVTLIGDYPCKGCTSFKEFIVLENNPAYKSIDGVLFIKDGTILIAYPYGKSNTYSIPNSVTKIGVYAFYGCTGLTSITIPNSLTSIENRAFDGCSGLTSVAIPNSVTTIEDHAFYGCTGLTSVIIPDGVTKIGPAAFMRCTSLKEFIVLDNNTSYKSIEGVLFNKDGTKLIAFPNSKSKTYSIPNSVTTIEYEAFYECTGLISITIPNSVTSIEYEAFFKCTGLTSITLPNSVKTIGNYAFYGCPLKQIYCKGMTSPQINSETFSDIYNSCTLYVPQEAYSDYWIAPYWGKFNSIIGQLTTSISGIDVRKTNVYTENGSIIVKGGKLGDTVEIYSVSGSLLHKKIITDDIVRINVALQRLYIVKAGDRSFKIAMQ